MQKINAPRVREPLARAARSVRAEALEDRRLMSAAALAAAQAPYFATPIAIAATGETTIQAEHYDRGGEGVAYHDREAANTSGLFRTGEGVDFKATADAGGGYRISDTRLGEWVGYTVDVRATGVYDLMLRVSNADAGGRLNVEVDGQRWTGTLAVPDTNSYGALTTVTRTGLTLAAGRHVLRLNMEAVAANGSAAGINWMRLRAVPPPTTATGGHITGAVYTDADGDGRRDAGEAGAREAWVYLDANNNARYEGTEVLVLSGSTGVYRFTNVPVGTHRVRIYPTNGDAQTAPALEGGGTVTVAAGQTVSGPEFGVRFVGYGHRISGRLFEDVDADGKFDDAEPGVHYAMVYVDLNNDGRTQYTEPAASTDEAGFYSIVLPVELAGTMTLKLIVRDGYRGTMPAGATYTVSRAPNVPATHWRNFGMTRNGMWVTGTIFNDANANGTRDAGEGGAHGVNVYVDEDNDGKYDEGEESDYTRSDGKYELTDVGSGTQQVRIQTGAWRQTSPTNNGPHTATRNSAKYQLVSGKNFGVVATGRIAGRVFDDVNGNGLLDAGENPSVSGRTVYLDLDEDRVRDAGEPARVTTSSGGYAFDRVVPEYYVVRQVLPAGHRESAPVADNDAAHGVRVNGGTHTLNFASTRLDVGFITGTVYNDTNGDGVFQTFEPWIRDRRVYLDVNGDNQFNTGERSVLTDREGRYAFAVAPGTYRVRTVLPANWYLTGPAGGTRVVSVISGRSAAATHFFTKPL